MLDENRRNQKLAFTAHWIAAVRAKESERHDHLFYDPWATALADAEGLAWIDKHSAESVLPIALRTRFFDDFLQRVAVEDHIRQIVLMGAGLDTRVFRLSWPARTRFFELDQASVMEFKERILGLAVATCKRRTIAVDLTSPWELMLKEAGFDPQLPSAWLLEGFLFYLSIDNLTTLLERAMRLATAGSYLGFDIINSITLTSPLTKKWVDMQAESGAPWIGTMEGPAGFLAAHDWEATLIPLGAPEANYDRWPYPVIPATLPGMPHLWFVVGKKVKATKNIQQHSAP